MVIKPDLFYNKRPSYNAWCVLLTWQLYAGSLNKHGIATDKTFLLKQNIKKLISDEDDIIIVEMILKSFLNIRL